MQPTRTQGVRLNLALLCMQISIEKFVHVFLGMKQLWSFACKVKHCVADTCQLRGRHIYTQTGIVWNLGPLLVMWISMNIHGLRWKPPIFLNQNTTDGIAKIDTKEKIKQVFECLPEASYGPKSKFLTQAHMCVRKQPETFPYFVIRLRRKKLRRRQLVPRL